MNHFDSVQANTAQSQIFREFLRENELLSKTILACLSGAQMASIHEIKKCQKSRDTAPLTNEPLHLQMSHHVNKWATTSPNEHSR